MRKLKLFAFLLAFIASVGMGWAIPTEFSYCYDCQRSPAYPKTSGSCTLSGFSNPYAGYKGIGSPGSTGNTSAGPWKVEFVEYYNSSSSLYSFSVSSIASTYGIAQNKVEIYRLYQWNSSANEYQHAAYGILCAYANESNSVEHAALFVANGNYGCYLTGKVHSGGSVTLTFDEDASTGFADLQPSTDEPDPSSTVVDLSTITTNYVIPDGATLTGTLQNNVKLTIANNATVTLNNVNINWNDQWTGGDYAGLTCNNAKIILADCSVNRVKGFLDGAPGIHVLPNYTLTIEGNGTLYTATHGGGAGIGCGYGSGRNGGNIVINGGTIYATGGNLAAGIGAGGRAKIGNITINGGIIYANAGSNSAGIGCGQTKNSSNKSQCGNITISSNVTYLKATKGSSAAHSIGKGSNSGTAVCGTATVAGVTGYKSDNPFIYSAAANNVKNLINAIGTVVYTPACKEKINAARAAYEALADYSCDADAVNTLKAAVSNYSTLTAAENAYDQFVANDVIALIDAIAPVAHDQATRNKLDAAFEAYDALTEEQKALVTNHSALTAAEAQYQALEEASISEMSNRFEFNYDCQRNPEYPKIGNACNLSNFSAPFVGYNGVGHPSSTGNVSKGPWKLEFVGYYHSSSDHGCTAVVTNVVNAYFSELSSAEKEAKKSEIPIFHLWQWNPNVHHYQSAAYGVVCAYAKEQNEVEHGALFIAGGGYGCFLSGHAHTDAFALVADYDVTFGLGGLIVAATITDPDQDAADYVIELIDDIPSPVEYVHAHKEAIDAARGAYDALTATQKTHVTNYTKLTDAEAEYAAHVAAEDQAAADVVIGKINAIGSPITYPGSGEAIQDARNAYETLTENQKDLVSNYNTLLEAEETYANLVDAYAADQIAAGTVIDLINAIGPVDNSLACGDRIEEARDAYDMLTDTQKAMVTNYSTLTDAEAEYASLPPSKERILQELYNALGDDVWTGYGVNTGVISYKQGTEPNSFNASFMGGTYSFDLPFEAFTEVSKADNGDGTYTYTLVVNLPAQTGMGTETLHVTMNANGEITEMDSENAGIEMQKEEGPVTGWAALQNAMNQGGVIKLGENVIAESTDAALEVPAGKTVVLELNGFTINRNLSNAVAEGSVIVNNGTLAIMGEGQITGGKTTGNGGGVLNNGIFTLYGGEITGNAAAIGGGVYNNGGAQGFWMTGGLIDNNTANSNPAIGGEVIFNENAAVQIDAQGTQVTIAQALANLATYSYIKPVMPNYDELETDYTLLQELYNALGDDVWTGYGVNTGVISYKQGTEPNSFNASFMGGTYSFDLPFEAFTEVSKADNGDGTYTYTLVVNLPAQTGMGTETLHVTMNANGEITEMDSENAGIEMQKEEGPVTGWAALQNAMNQGGVIKLGENVIAENTDAALTIPAGKTVVLELNGFTINRNLSNAVAEGSVIVNNGTLAIMGEGQITGGKTTGNGGGVLNNGIFTLYGGEITGNAAAIGGGVYNNGGAQGFWMTGGLIDGNTANSNPAIGGEVIFNENAAVQIDAQGTQVTIEQALAGLATYSYIKPVMPNYDELETDYTLLQELYNALGDDVWTGYGVNTGVISYKQGTEPNSFNASFMGGTYSFDLPFEAFTEVSKADNGDGTYTYTLVVNLPAQTGMGTETLHVTMNANGEITEMDSENAGIEMQKEEGPVTGWAALQNAMNQGGVIKLGENVIAESTDAALTIPAGKTVVLELNGFTINRNLSNAVAEGSVIINNGTLAIMGEGQITGGKTTGNGGGVLNNGIFTLYGGEITGNAAAIGGGVYNNGGAQGFWMTGGLIDGNTATTNPAIGGEVIFNENAAVQIDAQGTQVTIEQALAGLATYSYIKPVMPNYDELETDYTLLQELYNALGDDVWTGYGVNTGVISYKQGTEPNSFNASFMGGTYSFDLPFEAFTEVSKADNGDGTYTYTLVVNLPAQTGMGTETLHVTMNANGEITEMDSENAGIEMQKEEGPVTGWAALQNAMNQGGVIKLGENVVAENTDAALTIPAGKTVVLELNGFTINRNLSNAVADGSVIINNGTLAIMGEGQITGGKTTGNGGGVLNNGIFTLYGGEITGNAAAIGGGVYNNGGAQGFWMTGGLIDNNTATTNPAIGGEVIFNENAAVQIDAQGTQVTIEQALAGLATYSYIKPVMPNYDELETDYTLLQELYNALGNDVWTGYGVNTGVISYKQGTEPNSFNASFMGGTYSFDLPFEAFTEVSKADNGDGTYTYTLVVNLPAQTGMGTETLHVTMNANGEITEMDSENAGIEMQKEEGPVTGWAALQNAMNQGGVIKLGENVVAENTDAALEVPAGKTVVLELNGFTINRNLTNAVADGSVIVNNGTLAIMGEGQITGGKTTGNGGGVLNNGIFTLYGGEITGNAAAIGGGVYNNGGAQGFWMTGGLIDGNTANSNPAIGGAVIFNNMAVVQINADGDKVSIDDALAGLAIYDYIKPVMPDYDDYTAEVAIAANADPDNANVYYSTFYDSANKYMLPAGVEAYVADLSGNDLVLTKIAGAGQVLPADEAVILRANVQHFALVPSFEAPVAVSTNNDLEGVDEVTAVTAIDGLTRQNCYVLSGTVEYGVGFYRINSDYLKAHKAYVKYSGSANFAPRRMRFIFETATGIEDVHGNNAQSRKILENGVIYIIKNGVKYSVQGQVVK